MAIPIIIPKEGQSMETATITRWSVKKGDIVRMGDVLCEVESEKASFDIESPVSGTVLDIFYDAYAQVPVAVAIAVIGKKGEDYESFRPKASVSKTDSSNEHEKSDEENPVEISKLSTSQNDFLQTRSAEVSPRAKKLAKDRNIPISLIIRSKVKEGPVTEKDVMKYLSGNHPLTPAAREYVKNAGISKVPSSGTGLGSRVTVQDVLACDKEVRHTSEAAPIPLSGMRKTISEKMLSSIQTTAQFTLNCHADATALLALRAKMKESPLELDGVTINDIILYAVAKTLVNFKEMNAHFVNGILTRFEQVNLGCAVAVPDGLLVPVIKEADRMSIKQISGTMKSLALACREGRIKPQEIRGGTFTVTSLGSLGIEFFTPILNLPEVGILGVGAIQPRPVRKNGAMEFIDHIALSLTVNHQIIDGTVGAGFLKLLTKYLADIDLLLAV